MGIIEDGMGTGKKAHVNNENRLVVASKSESLQHMVSQEFQQAYQCIGTTSLTSGTVTMIHIKNISSNKNMIFTYVRHQVVEASGGTSFPNRSNYFKISLGRTYVSGGTLHDCSNLYGGSLNVAEVEAYKDGITLAGTEKEIDRWYTKAVGDMNTFNKEGSVIIPPNETIEFSYVGDRTAGFIYARASYIMENREI